MSKFDPDEERPYASNRPRYGKPPRGRSPSQSDEDNPFAESGSSSGEESSSEEERSTGASARVGSEESVEQIRAQIAENQERLKNIQAVRAEMLAKAKATGKTPENSASASDKIPLTPTLPNNSSLASAPASGNRMEKYASAHTRDNLRDCARVFSTEVDVHWVPVGQSASFTIPKEAFIPNTHAIAPSAKDIDRVKIVKIVLTEQSNENKGVAVITAEDSFLNTMTRCNVGSGSSVQQPKYLVAINGETKPQVVRRCIYNAKHVLNDPSFHKYARLNLNVLKAKQAKDPKEIDVRLDRPDLLLVQTGGLLEEVLEWAEGAVRKVVLPELEPHKAKWTAYVAEDVTAQLVKCSKIINGMQFVNLSKGGLELSLKFISNNITSVKVTCSLQIFYTLPTIIDDQPEAAPLLAAASVQQSAKERLMAMQF